MRRCAAWHPYHFHLSDGFMIHEKNLDAEFVLNFLGKMEKRPPDKQLLLKGKNTYDLIKTTLLRDMKAETCKWY